MATQIKKRTRDDYLKYKVEQVTLKPELSVGELMDKFASMSIQAGNLGRAGKLYERMLTDPERPTIFLGLAGPLIAAGLRQVIRQLIEYRLVDVVVSTGAIIYQDYYQAQGGSHYRGSPYMDDNELRKLRIDRIYDALIDDEIVFECDRKLAGLISKLPPGNYSSRELMVAIGKSLTSAQDSILRTAVDNEIPIFVPALNDSSIGIGFTAYYASSVVGSSSSSSNNLNTKVIVDALKDNYELVQIIMQSKATSVIYIGGGVPKNFINDAIVTARYDFGAKVEGHKYAIQLSTGIEADGGLSSSPFSEAKSWGKISLEATTVSVFVEASIGLPLLVGYVLSKNLHLNRTKLKFDFNRKIKYIGG